MHTSRNCFSRRERSTPLVACARRGEGARGDEPPVLVKSRGNLRVVARGTVCFVVELTFSQQGQQQQHHTRLRVEKACRMNRRGGAKSSRTWYIRASDILNAVGLLRFRYRRQQGQGRPILFSLLYVKVLFAQKQLRSCEGSVPWLALFWPCWRGRKRNYYKVRAPTAVPLFLTSPPPRVARTIAWSYCTGGVMTVSL